MLIPIDKNHEVFKGLDNRTIAIALRDASKKLNLDIKVSSDPSDAEIENIFSAVNCEREKLAKEKLGHFFTGKEINLISQYSIQLPPLRTISEDDVDKIREVINLKLIQNNETR